ncbi:MAG TPA: methylated-DNA--[protein]-cysteine S-methyltransferase [Candidatus Thermoplasmatota archaeon]|jgi:methylated-DNA-[protein]-cysteine S-methyltransferase|nr:methylated-DNA--[protein]-cysteine S-methyltransferase [Candidatus Thermoplasmatota archaeon]
MALRLTVRVPLDSDLARRTRDAPRARLEGVPLGTRVMVRNGDGTRLERLPPQEHRVLARVERAGALLLPPLRWQGGALELGLLAPDEACLARLRAACPGLELLAKRAADEGALVPELLGARALLPDLTRRQAQALLKALDMGYYAAPRKVTTGEVASALGVARSTFEEHLKRAESQLIGAMAPMVRLHAEGDDGGRRAAEAVEVYARFSASLGLYVHLAMKGDRVRRVKLARAPPRGSHGRDHPYLARILQHVATGKDDLRDIPLDLEVAPFELQVLEAMRRIPPGEVRTYGELARALGKPGAARAVGNACAKNPAPIVVPCHRVVPSDGSLGNYSGEGGARTKRKLLAKEGALEGV